METATAAESATPVSSDLAAGPAANELTPNAYPTTSRIEWIPLRLIDLHPLARTHNAGKLASLSGKLKQQGQLQNIVVCPKEGGRFEVIAGLGRVLNAQSLEWDKILACIREGLSEFQKLSIMLSENEERELESPIHKGIVYQGMMDAEHWTQVELADRLGESRQVLQQYLSLLKLPDVILKNANRFAFFGLTHYLQILRLDGEADQVDMVENCVKNDWSVKELTREVDKKRKTTEGGKAKGEGRNGKESQSRLAHHPLSFEFKEVGSRVHITAAWDRSSGDMDGYFAQFRAALLQWTNEHPYPAASDQPSAPPSVTLAEAGVHEMDFKGMSEDQFMEHAHNIQAAIDAKVRARAANDEGALKEAEEQLARETAVKST